MPIGIDQFERAEKRSTGERIVRFLLSHDEQAFTRTEIAEAINADPNTVGTNLSRLKQRGLVRHREPHWAIIENTERVASAFKTRSEMEWLNERLGPFDADRAAVRETAVDSERDDANE